MCVCLLCRSAWCARVSFCWRCLDLCLCLCPCLYVKNVCISTCVDVGQMQHRFCHESSLMSAFLVALDLIRCVACLATHVIARPCSPISWYLSTVWTPITMATWSTDTSRVTTCQVAQILIPLGGFSIKHCAKKSFHTILHGNGADVHERRFGGGEREGQSANC